MISFVWAAGVLLAVGYLLLMRLYWRGWKRSPFIPQKNDFQPHTGISVIIAARNEADHIAACLSSVVGGNYPAHLLEIIVVDDHSTDATAAIVQAIAAQYVGKISIRLVDPGVGTGKKNAVATGIRLATHPYIACTDADCEVPVRWLWLIAQVFETQQAQLIAGPVVFHREKKLVEWFQSLDLLGLMGVTGAGIQSRSQHLANGANIAYPKKVFEAVGGFEGNAHIASGDDLFLVQKVAKNWPGSIVFLKNPGAAVNTLAMSSWPAFIRQRLRWGSKNAALPEWPVRLSLALVFVHSWAVVLTAAGAIMEATYRPVFVLLLCSKMIPDYFFLQQMSRFFNKKTAMQWFLPGTVLHILYIAGIGLGSLLVKRYSWKRRRVG
jgi:cellulose synthase/poly-beta-1,6-N-acetylglucosamine synthase-like glycosyltransferase